MSNKKDFYINLYCSQEKDNWNVDLAYSDSDGVRGMAQSSNKDFDYAITEALYKMMVKAKVVNKTVKPVNKTEDQPDKHKLDKTVSNLVSFNNHPGHMVTGKKTNDNSISEGKNKIEDLVEQIQKLEKKNEEIESKLNKIAEMNKKNEEVILPYDTNDILRSLLPF